MRNMIDVGPTKIVNTPIGEEGRLAALAAQERHPEKYITCTHGIHSEMWFELENCPYCCATGKCPAPWHFPVF